MHIKVADYIADWLTSKKIKHVFTVTGGGAMHLNNAFGKHPKLKCVYNHHEQACAMAAESYARLSRQIALVCVTSGPGGTNAITGVLGGWLDSIPMLIISGQVRFSTTVRSTGLNLRQLGDQEFDITKVVAPMTKYAEMVIEPTDILYHLEKAYYLAVHGRPGPCWLDIPLDVQGAIIDTKKLKKYNPQEDIREIAPKVSEKTVLKILERIQKAERPVILAGSAVRSSGAFDNFHKLIKKLNVPVVTAWNAHDVIWNSHPLYFGRPGTIGNRCGNFITQNADLVMVMGCRLNIRQISYNWEMFAREAYKIIVDIDQNELKKPTLAPDLPVLADVADLIKLLLKKVVTLPKKKAWMDYCRSIRRQFENLCGAGSAGRAKVNPYYFVDSFTRKLKEKDIIVTANGSACVVTFQAAVIKKGQRLYTNSGCASMGYDLPAAIGAHMASGRKVYCIAGDGSMQMNIQELQTIIHNKMNITIFLFNNDGYHSIRQTQNSFFGKPLVGVNSSSGISFPDAEKIARAYGLKYAKIVNNASLKPVLNRVLKMKGPVFCEVVLNPKQNFEPKLASKNLGNGKMFTPPLEDMYPFLDRDTFKECMIIKTIKEE
ncbi:MAG TPA: thiamine pyrophosphate-binding protein [Smithella sp.]|nr:thiamine pyrophosphate-binding protein [Smithella sp.]MDM7985953.1 thiamine pyrophosphate-binding protein [Smithella sp.]HNY51061.1 thiamine pyrophosphate-binding protein [Smithella sp.]HOG91177.1 thiamine pyrophosphate-binding protein [Smithella sp.]HOU51586.1 thiamine pyrophosphate-binding protein [Smithella sp.]